MEHPKPASIDCRRPEPFRWGKWDQEPRTTGYSRSFLVLVILAIACAMLAFRFPESIFPRTGSRPWGGWSFLGLLCGVLALTTALSKHFRIDRAEVDSGGITVMFSFIPKMLGRFETTTMRFDWRSVADVTEEAVNDGEGGDTFAIGVALLEPLKTGARKINLEMPDKEAMHKAFGKIRALQARVENHRASRNLRSAC